jgi:hypothetical protein
MSNDNVDVQLPYFILNIKRRLRFSNGYVQQNGYLLNSYAGNSNDNNNNSFA